MEVKANLCSEIFKSRVILKLGARRIKSLEFLFDAGFDISKNAFVALFSLDSTG